MSDYPALTANGPLAGSLTGTSVGRFAIGDRLGRGGMGEVYRAVDTRLKRTVAMKRLSPGLRSDPLYRRRFLEEAERASSFTDTHVAALHDVLEIQDEIFLVMEFVEGQTLRQRLREPMSLEQFLGIAIQCAEALVAAHERGIVHCDIKPENIMLTPTGQVKILDFGVAKHLPRSDQSSTIDRSGTVGGTPAYMSPEVLLEKPPDGRADIFSLGIVLYEALSGQHPFLAGSYVATTHRIIHEAPTPIHVFNPKVPGELEDIVSTALAKEPSQRYANARDLLEDLSAVREGVTPSKVLPLLKQRRRKAWVPAFVFATLVLLAFVGLSVWQLPAARRWLGLPPPKSAQMHLAILPFTPSSNDSNSRAFADGLTETVAVRLTQLTSSYPLQIVPPREISAGTIQTAEQARRSFGVNTVLEGNLRESNNVVRVSYSLVDATNLTQIRSDTVTVDAGKPFDVEDRVLESIVGLLGFELRPSDKAALLAHGTQQPAAYDFYLRARGYLQEYEKPGNLQSAITVFQHALETDPNYALAHAGLGQSYLHQYERTREANWIQKAEQSCRRAVSLAGDLADGHVCSGLVDNNTGHYENAVEEFQRAVQIDPTSDDGFRGLATAYQRLGKLSDAEHTYLRAIELRPQYWGGYAWLGSFYWGQARYDDAARMFSQLIALAPDSFQGYSDLGGVYLTQDRYDDAIRELEKSVSIYPTSDAYSNLATAYFYRGDYTTAARTYEKAQQTGGSDTSSYLVWGNLAEGYYWAPGERDRSMAAYQKAIALAEDQLRVNARDTSVLDHLALYHAMLQHKTPALNYLQQAIALDSGDPELSFIAAKVYTQLGDQPTALNYLGRAINAGYSKYVVRADPMFKVLAGNPQFQKMSAAK
jgi:serine/threonine protein kinase/tetratricopeptide (TPR) repeat protein